MKLDFMDDDCDIEGNPLEDKWKYKSHQRYTITKIKNGLWEVAWQDGTTSTHSTQKGAEVMVEQLKSYGLALSSIKHPRPSFFKRLLYYFIRPRFSSKAVEPVQDYLNNQIKKIEDNIR